MTGITGSVGTGGANRAADVRVIQELLNRHMARFGLPPLIVDGLCGPKTSEAVRRYQQMVVKLTMPDGRVDPAGLTLGALTADLPQNIAHLATPKDDWSGDSSTWTQAKKLASLSGAFRVKVERVIATLAEAGFQPKIFFGWRSVEVQKKLVKEGRSKVTFSFHNAQTKKGIPNAWAVDLIDARWGWEKAEAKTFFKALGKAAKAEGLVWGGDWEDFRDWAHIQGKANSELARVKQDSGF
jgi:hypothetical protein